MKRAIFTVSYAGFWGQAHLPLERMPAKARALGYDGLMIMAKRPHAYPAEMNAERRAALRKALDDHGVEAVCIGAYTSFTSGLEATEVPLVDLQADYVGRCAEMARDLGCSLVRIFTGYEVAGVPFGQQWRRCIEGVRACCDAAAAFDVTVGVQNHHDIAVHTASLDEFVREVDRPNCAPLLDAWSPALRGEDLAEAAARLGGRTPQTIVADYVRLPRARYVPELVNYDAGEANGAPRPDIVRAVPLGDGFIDYTTFFRGLVAAGFDGWAVYEMCSPLRGGGSEENLDHCARRFLDFLDRLEDDPAEA